MQNDLVVSNCIDILYEKVSKELAISREDYERTLIGWDIQPIFIDEKKIGVIMLRDREIHVHIEPNQALLHARRIIHQYLDANIQKHQYLTTVSFKEPTIVWFLERLGFYKTGESDVLFFYRIDQTKIH